MSLWLFFKDELRGFYKSSVMIVLWVGMPMLSILMHFIQPDLEGLPITPFVGIMLAQIGGTLASVMLSTTIVNEKNKNVYDLFLIRPIKRHNLLIAKFLATYVCLIIASVFSLILGVLIDSITLELEMSIVLENLWESIVISMMAMAIATSAGILIGLLANSVMVAAILAIFVGNQLSIASMLPSLIIESINPVIFSTLIGVPFTIIIILIFSILMNRKQF
ncbi:hypothetical protein NEF87_002192 [Candidatus Lokiarchaeum ossiferum]|uniref:ABC-2 family transporter protein n=1 Tax=Candidatus Lokiarchaeum ossiferum TaxID=2951803 RepID=A0ABY6HU83_9ARCH|nr:hypothetical protein NEF87_002192 [Candidatus Lokiarchaeum sp. B-35]